MLSRAVNTGQAWGTIATAANTDLYSPNKLKVFLPASIVQMIVQKHNTEIFTPTPPPNATFEVWCPLKPEMGF